MAVIEELIVGEETYKLVIPGGLTEEQKAQIRANIGAISATDADVVRDGDYPEMTVGNAKNAGSYVQATISTSAWSSTAKTAVVTITGVAADSKLIISPADESAATYVTCGIKATTQADGLITFTCMSVPTVTVTVNILIL